MYFGPGISVGRRGISYGDSDAQAFISATGLTGATEVAAVNTLVANLKSYGLWSKMKAIYPFVSDTNNLLSYSQDFANGIWQKTQSSITANVTTAPNGTNTASKLVENTTNNNHNIFQQATIGNVQMTFSIYAKKSERSYCYVNMSDLTTGDASVKVDLNTGTLSSTGIAVGSWTNISSSISDAGNGWYRISLTATKNAGTISQPYVVLLNNSQATPYLGDGTSGLFLWGSQLELGSSATTYQPIATTPANRFVSQFKYNLKDPRDLDAAFRLAFNGTWAYSKQGATPNGVNGYANTYLTPNGTLAQNSKHLSSYTRTAINNTLIGAGDTNTLYDDQIIQVSTSLYANLSSLPSAVTQAANTGLYAVSRLTNLTSKSYRNGAFIANDNQVSTGNTSRQYYIGARNIPTADFYSNNQIAFTTIGDGLTDTEATNLYTSIQAFQTSLSRQV